MNGSQLVKTLYKTRSSYLLMKREFPTITQYIGIRPIIQRLQIIRMNFFAYKVDNSKITENQSDNLIGIGRILTLFGR
jgi:hypothetical protein